jgi:pilus assembly protein CpaE
MDEVIKAIRTALSQQERRRALLSGEPVAGPRSAGMVITIFGAKGGIGKTTMATNLAAALVSINAGSAVVVDVDTIFGDAAMMLDIPIEVSLPDAAGRVEELDRESLGSSLARHSSGIRVLPAPFEPTDWRNVSPEAVDKVLTLLAQTHDFVIVDCPATFTDLVAVALEKATVVLLMTSLDITSIKDTTTAFKLLSGGMKTEDKIKLVINHATNVNSVREEDVSKVLRREVFWSVPYDAHVSASLQMGTPVVIDQPLSDISETIREMAATLAGVEIGYGGDGRTAEVASRGILGRLFKGQ